MHKNRFPALRYANDDRHKSGSVVKRSLSLFTAFRNH
ncbi:hypothetical protein T12_1582 [Trichinella patagoniensis]|uniref:Uncharacterized protein n=1 Tax=Trichinella patagoniensis TaxID=990121 RepID=A0A0V0UUQ0_9BILA|nr:hypothetical protein T12_1582 [Trichinella patagoniensis]